MYRWAGLCGRVSRQVFSLLEDDPLCSRYLLDDMEIREFTVYLEQYYCNPDQDRCPGQIVNYFPTMHRMAMEKYK